MLYELLIGGVIGAGCAVLGWLIYGKPIDRGSVSDAWRAEQRGRKDQ